MPPGPPQGTSVLHTLGKYFPECYKRCLGVGSLLLLRRWHILLRAGVSSVPTWRTSAFPSGLLGRILQFLHSEGNEGDLTGLLPVARTTLLIDHNRSGIRLDVSAARSTRRDGVRPTSVATTFRIGKARISWAFKRGGTSNVGFQLGCILGPRGVRCIEVWGQTGTWAIWCSG
jgi:hypothetical protein